MALPLMLRLRGTVILTIWWQVGLVLLYTVGLVVAHKETVLDLRVDGSYLSVIGLSISMVLGFRTNTAYDRYWEGRRLWSSMTTSIRTLTRCFWLMVEEKENSSREVIEKVSATNLLVAFVYATRNYLRDDYSYEGDGLRELLSHLPKFSTPSSNIPLDEQQTQNGGSSRSASSSSGEVNEMSVIQRMNVANSTTPQGKQAKGYNIKAYDTEVSSNIPIELSYYIGAYIQSVRKRDLVHPSSITVMNNALNNLVDCLGGFERILRTPIPLAYSVHLHHAVWVYILTLPFQVVEKLGWATILGVPLAAFVLLGILSIGWEIENPFGNDANDLPLDDFCRVIHTEILRIVGNRMPATDSWMMSPENHPLSLVSNFTAVKLAEMEKDEVLNILEKLSHVQLDKKISKKRQWWKRACVGERMCNTVA